MLINTNQGESTMLLMNNPELSAATARERHLELIEQAAIERRVRQAQAQNPQRSVVTLLGVQIIGTLRSIAWSLRSGTIAQGEPAPTGK
ncbi:MAG: hypothetical protein KJZ93_26840 [Caldilineaceae bacterium]|nr:hypothetical protein [Caldilineaceae bacterium]